MSGLVGMLYSLFLVAGVLRRYRLLLKERRLDTLGFVALRCLPLPTLPVVTLMLVAFLREVR